MKSLNTEKINVRKRLFTFARIFVCIILDFRKESILINRKGYNYARNKMLKKHEQRAQELYNTAIQFKGALIKLCQLLSTRVDVLPEPYIRILKPLQDNVPPVEFEELHRVIQSEYENYNDIFSEIDRNPLASASLAQVHKAILKSGESIVLKIFKPDIENIIDVDFAIIHFVFRLLSHLKFFREQVQLDVIFDDFVIITGDELNFKREAYIASGFEKHFSNFPGIKIPKIYNQYSTQRILVMEYVEGFKISEKDKWTWKNNIPDDVIRNLIKFYVEQIFYTDYIHFDPHPGNILVLNNSEIAILDFGMSGITTEKMRTGLWEAIDSILKKDASRLIKALDSLGFFKRDFNKNLLVPVFEQVFDNIYELFDSTHLDRESIQMNIRNINIQPVLDYLIKIMYTNSITLPANWVYIGKTLGSLIGLIANLNPEFRIFTELKPHINNFINKNYSYFIKKNLNILYSNLNSLITLPVKIDDFINKIESESMNIKIDYAEIEEKLDNFRIFTIRLTCFFIFLLSGFFSYFSLRFKYYDISIMLAIFTVLAFIITVFYRNRSVKENIKSNIEKMI